VAGMTIALDLTAIYSEYFLVKIFRLSRQVC